MLPLGLAMITVGGVLGTAGVTGSTIHSVVQGKPDKSKAGGLGNSAGGTGAITGSSTATGGSPSAVRKQIVQYYMGKGLTKAQSAGIAGNAQQESSLNPKISLFQDIGGRGAGQGATLQQQLDKAWQELLGPESGSLAALRRTSTPQDAARVFSQLFERPSEPNLPARERYAQEAYEE